MESEREQEEQRTALGDLLQLLRKRKRFTRHALSSKSGVSTTYVVQIEGGVDARTGKEVHPSPPILRKLADALGDDNPTDADQFYQRLMAAAGYLRGDDAAAMQTRVEEKPSYITTATNAPQFSTPPADNIPFFETRSTRAPLHAPAFEPGAPVTVALLDARLHTHFKAVVDHWEELSVDEQTAVLTLMELLDEKPRRR